MTYPVLLVADRGLIRAGIKALIDQSSEFQVAAEAEEATEALEMARRLRPGLVVVNAGMPDGAGIEAAVQILEGWPEAPVVIVSLADEEDARAAVLRSGARGLVEKQASQPELLDALRTVACGGSYFCPPMSEQLMARVNLHARNGNGRPVKATRLTRRELEVLRMAAAGHTSREIAARLGLSVETVRSYRKSMMRKLGVRNVAGLIHAALGERLVRGAGGL
jgi:DNA-binding NarL/FixJ family response regulator